MMNTRKKNAGSRGFTLIEMLVVIGVIAILAGLAIPALVFASRKKIDSRAEGELAQLVTAIEDYKAKKGFYPPSNPRDVTKPPLYYELKGTRKTTTGYETLDGVASIIQPALVAYGVQGFVNSTTGGPGDDNDPDRPAVANFHQKLKQGLQTGWVGSTNLLFLGIPYKGPDGDFSRWRYNSINPTNNKEGFDLWIDLVVGSKTNTYGNWKR